MPQVRFLSLLFSYFDMDTNIFDVLLMLKYLIKTKYYCK